jgi:hypothetical protein
MYLITKVVTFTTTFLLPFTGNTDDTVALPSTSDGIYSRVPQMEVGKAKRISKDELPSDLSEATEKILKKVNVNTKQYLKRTSILLITTIIYAPDQKPYPTYKYHLLISAQQS